MTDGKNRYVDLAVHCIGLDRKRPYARHNKRFYRPYRNYFASGREHEGWDVMVLAGKGWTGLGKSSGSIFMTRRIRETGKRSQDAADEIKKDRR